MASPTAPTAATEATPPHYSINTPLIQTVHYLDGRNPTYSPVHDGEIQPFPPSFTMPQAGTEPTAALLSELFWPDSLLNSIVQSTNSYARSRLPAVKFKLLSKKDILHFLSTITYMGLIRLPCKDDYFKIGPQDIWPIHVTKSNIHQQEPYPASVGR
ncbi:transposase IS4 [Nitzschia inconspicua]|uniref:Transposase IS4 n=1 Tax=Nitzschia inconspicua TaxID=303405 RepID=A0A9K3LGF3_9STRA|nr:transposase IS4 [Nitzschia inconspicua]